MPRQSALDLSVAEAAAFVDAFSALVSVACGSVALPRFEVDFPGYGTGRDTRASAMTRARDVRRVKSLLERLTLHERVFRRRAHLPAPKARLLNSSTALSA